jgi:TonB-linked SusC/RagA family outer membrane protein
MIKLSFLFMLDTPLSISRFLLKNSNNRMMKKGNKQWIIWGLIAFIGWQNAAFAYNHPPLQEVKTPIAFVVKGKVIDELREPLVGASVTIKGTSQGTIADAYGNFEILANSGDDILVISYVGYLTKEEPINGRSTIDVVLTENASVLSQVVVIGYGEAQRKDLTGSIASVSEKQIKEIPATTFQAALQGRTPGVLATQSSGDLRGGMNILIRGINSVNLSSQPLYVVDGVPLFTGNLYHLNPDDIEKIDVLKDASAAAIYGSRAANGVVMITTKGGKASKTAIEFSADYGLQQIISRLNMMNSFELAKMWQVGRELRGQAKVPELDDQAFLAANNNDFQSLVTRDAPWQRYSLSATGGNDKTKFSISAGYENRKGIIINSDFQRANVRSNVDFKVNNFLKVGTRLGISSYWGSNAGADAVFGDNPFTLALYSKPWVPVYDGKGDLAGPPSVTGPYQGFTPAPILRQTLDVRDLTELRFIGSVYAEAEILKGLTFRSSFGSDLFSNNNYSFSPSYNYGAGDYIRQLSSVSRSSLSQNNLVTDQVLTYKKQLFKKHSLQAMAGYSLQKYRSVGFSVTRSGATDNNFSEPNINQPLLDANSGNNNPLTSALISYFGRLVYDCDDRYLFTATLRRDGSSRFPAATRFGYFPSVSAGWRISNERFFKNVKFVSDLKLRASWGIAGNQDISDAAKYQVIGAGANVFGNAYTLSNLGNNNLKWEQAEQTDIGLDAVFWGDKINLTFDYFEKENRDLLLNRQIPLLTGVDQASQTVNLGTLKNKGWEMGLGGNFKFGALSWEPMLTISAYKNTIVNIGKTIDGKPERLFGQAQPSGAGTMNMSIEGYPVGMFHGLMWEGVYQTGEVITIRNPGVTAGDFKFKDLNGDGIINNDDRTFIGDPNPDFYGGFNNTFAYKGVTLSIFSTFSYGNDIYNVIKTWITSGYPGYNSYRENNYWTATNPSNEYPKPFSANYFTYGHVSSSRWVEDGSYFRIKNVSLSYDLPLKWLKPLKMQGLRLSAVGTNLLTFTKYSGIDPESNSGNNISGSQLSQGLDIQPYPFAKSFMFKINVSF